jgi:hypothetical protein
MRLTILLLLISITSFGQIQMTDPSGAKVKFYNEADVPTIVVNDSATFRLGKGIKYMPMVLWLESVDTSKENTITIYKNKPKAVKPPPLPAIVQTYFTDINTSTKVTLGGTWTKAAKTATATWPDEFEGDNVAFTYNVNDFVSYDFTGDSIQVVGERRENHGIVGVVLSKGTTVIDTASVDTYLNTKANQPSILYSSKRLQHGQYSIKVFFKKFSGATRNSIVLDGFRVFSTQQISVVDDPVQPTPTGDILNVTPTSNVKSIIETASNKTIKFADGVYNLPNISVPVGVSIDLGNAVVNATTPGNFNEQKAVFHFSSGSKVAGNQFIQGGTIKGNNIAACGIIVTNRDNVHVRNVNLSDFKFVGVWVQNASGGSIGPAKLFNTSGATNSWASGEVCFTNISNYDIHDIHVSSNASTRGYGFKALYNNGTIGPNVRFRNLTTAMNHSSIWNGGQSRNIGFELSETKLIAPVEIHNNTFGNQVSFAIGYQDQGELIVRDNIFDTGGDTYAIETLLDNLKFYNNTIRNTQMMFANFRINKKWKNWVVYNNRFESSPGVPSWGGVFLIGGAGVENVRIYNNVIAQPAGSALIKYMGVTGGVMVQ